VIKKFSNPALWLAALAILFIVIKKTKAKFFSMATDVGDKLGESASTKLVEASETFGRSLQEATEEAFSMTSEKEMVIKTKGKESGTSFRETRKLDLEARIVGGDAYKQVQQLADKFDVMAEGNLFPAVKKMTENTANWLRDISMGSKQNSLLAALTEKNNEKIMDRLDFRKQESSILNEMNNRELSGNDARQKELSERLKKLKEQGNMGWEYRKLDKELNNLMKEEEKITNRIGAENARILNLERSTYDLMSNKQKKVLFESLKAKKEELEASNKGLMLRKEELELSSDMLSKQESFMNQEMKRIEEKGKSSSLSQEEVSQYNKMNEELKNIKSRQVDVNQELNVASMELSKQSKETSLIDDKMNKLKESVSGVSNNKEMLAGLETKKSEIELAKDSLRLKQEELALSLNNLSSQKSSIEQELKKLETKKGQSILTEEEKNSYNKMSEDLKNIESKHYSINKELEKASNQYDRQENKSQKISEKLMKVAEEASKASEIMENIDIPLKESPLKRMMNYMGSSFRNAGSVISTTFDKAGNSIRQIKDNIAEKLKPENWLTSIKAGLRGMTSRENNSLVNAMKGMGTKLGSLKGAFGGIGKVMGSLGLAMLGLNLIMDLLKPVFDALKPAIDILKDVVMELAASLLEKILPPILRVMAKLLPVLGMLVDKLLPPALQILGKIVELVGKYLISTLGKLILGLTELGFKIAASFTREGKIERELNEDPNLFNSYMARVRENAEKNNLPQLSESQIRSQFASAIKDDARGLWAELKAESSGIGRFANGVIGFGETIGNVGKDVAALGESMRGSTTFYDAATKIAEVIQQQADDIEKNGFPRPTPKELEESQGTTPTGLDFGYSETEEPPETSSESTPQVIGVSGAGNSAQFREEQAAQERQIQATTGVLDNTGNIAENTGVQINQTSETNRLLNELLMAVQGLSNGMPKIITPNSSQPIQTGSD
jgi:hypothetical protein